MKRTMTDEEYDAWYQKNFGTRPGHVASLESSAGATPSSRVRENKTPVPRPLEADACSEEEEDTEQLRQLWHQMFRKQVKAAYRDPLSTPRQRELFGQLLEAAGSLSKAEQAIRALFTHPKLKWVSSISIEWLCDARNYSRFVAPVLSDRSKTATDWKQDRKAVSRVLFRRTV